MAADDFRLMMITQMHKGLSTFSVTFWTMSGSVIFYIYW